MADDPNELFTKIFFRLLNADSDVGSMRRIAEAGAAIAEAQIPDMNRLWVDQLLGDAANDAMFIDKEKFLTERGGAQGLANGMAQQELEAFRGSIDAASIVFVHSGLDAAAHDLCRVVHTVDFRAWYDRVAEKQVSLKDACERESDVLVRERTSEFVERLSRTSLLEKIEHLFRVCKPDGYQRKGFNYDKEYLEKIDRLRHDIIHGDKRRRRLERVPEYLKYLNDTGLFLWGMVNFRFGVKLDPAYLP
jgi:hypothetical protein